MTVPRDRPDHTRRQALHLLGTAAAGVVAAGVRPARSQQTFTSAEPPAFGDGSIIRTLRGDLDPRSLANGATLFHEHVGREDIDLAVEELRQCAWGGLGCIVDSATGRRTPEQVANLEAIAARSDVRIVAAGSYFQDVGFALYPVRVAEMSEDELVEELVADAAAQCWGAFGEIASSLEMRPDERRVHRAIARAHLETGLPIFTHTPHESCPSCAMDQMDIYDEVGVNFSHLVIGHMATIKPEHDPFATHREIARRGAFIGLDTLGHEMGRSDIPAADKVRMVQDLLEAGLEDHILLSSDQGNVRQFNRNYGHGWASVLMQFVPKLRFAGIGEESIRKILVDNPRRFLAFVPRA
ncbi:MAG: amidohydrolase family protein [Acidobacteriota bacterium]|nr:amidohydrolase family protein [Acidobacteriota bacterium]